MNGLKKRLLFLVFTFSLIQLSSTALADAAYCWPGSYGAECSADASASSGHCPAATPYCKGYCDSAAVCIGWFCWGWDKCAVSQQTCTNDAPCVECMSDAHCSRGKVCTNNACVCPSEMPRWNGTACAPPKLTCAIKTSCAAGETDIFHLAGTSHAELASEGAYASKVCCDNGNIQLSSSCSAIHHTVVLALSDVTNAHAEIPGSANYLNEVCLGSDEKDLSIACTYRGSCASTQTCLASISSSELGGSTNLHVAGCDDPNAYADRICCSSVTRSTKTFVNGSVRDLSGHGLAGVAVRVFPSSMGNPLVSKTTDANGFYSINLSDFTTPPLLKVNIIATLDGFMPGTKEGFTALFDRTATQDFTFSTGTGCLPDCTKAEDQYHLCDPSCDGLNGCAFDPTTKDICTKPPQPRGARKYIGRSEDEEVAAYCCTSPPVSEKKVLVKDVSCGKGDVVKVTAPVKIDGEQAKLVVVSCKKS